MQQDEHNPNHFRRLAALARIATLTLFVALFLGTHLPVPETISNEVADHDKLLHYWAYLSLSLALLTSWELFIGRLQPVHYFVVFLVGALYGAFDEITQIPVGRTCELMDWVFDVAGFTTGLVLYRVLRPLLFRMVAWVPVAVRS
jgi:VanZ family protein